MVKVSHFPPLDYTISNGFYTNGTPRNTGCRRIVVLVRKETLNPKRLCESLGSYASSLWGRKWTIHKSPSTWTRHSGSGSSLSTPLPVARVLDWLYAGEPVWQVRSAERFSRVQFRSRDFLRCFLEWIDIKDFSGVNTTDVATASITTTIYAVIVKVFCIFVGVRVLNVLYNVLTVPDYE